MKTVSTMALGLALAFGATAQPAFAKDKAPKAAAAKYSPAVQKGYNDALKAVTAGDIPTATAKYQELKAAAQTEDDKNAVGSLAIQIGQKSNNQALMGEGIDMVLASGKATPEQQVTFYVVQGKLAYQAKDNAKAEAAFLQAQKLGSQDPELVPLLVETKTSNGKTLEALQMLETEAARRRAAGQEVPNNWYGRGINIGLQAKPTTPADRAALNASIQKISEAWLASYPTKSNWRDALIIYRDQNKIDESTEVDMLRLLRSAGALKGERDYMDYVLPTYNRFPGEAKQVLDEGVAAGMINVATNKDARDIRGIVTAKMAADKASLPGSEKAAQAAATGKIALATADSYLGYADYPKAIAMYKLALTKGGVDANMVNTRMGIALAKSGQKDAAKQAFASVTGPREGLAHFWTIFVDHPPTA